MNHNQYSDDPNQQSFSEFLDLGEPAHHIPERQTQDQEMMAPTITGTEEQNYIDFVVERNKIAPERN